MLNEIDGLMSKYEVDALYLQGKSLLKPNLYYMTRFLTVDDCFFVKLCDQPGTLATLDLVCERAKKYSPVRKFHSISPTSNQAIRDRVSREEYTHRIVTDVVKNLIPLNGLVGIPDDTNALHVHFLHQMGVRTKPVQELFLEARETKDSMEILAIEKASRATEATFQQVIEVFQNCDIGAKQVLLYKKQKLTVGRLKQIIEHSLVENDAENSEESIVAGGIKGADFHYLGLRNDTLYANEPIIVDIFPRRIEERYHADITRTIVRGKVSKKVQKLFESVETVLDDILNILQAGGNTEDLVNVMADSFERDGHSSAHRTPDIKEGMLHALGHGIGLNVHEHPRLTLHPNQIKSGSVIAVEPALYYQQVGGIRIEDDLVVTQKGAHSITKLPKTIFL